MNIILESKSRVRGMFQIERQQHYPDGSPIPGTKEIVAPWQDNLLLNSGLDNLANPDFMRSCHIGSGSSSPVVTQTVLDSELAAVTPVTQQISPGPVGSDYVSLVGVFVFAPGVGTGIIAELGVSPPSGPLTTRALVRDENGSPTTITKGPIDSLTITYQLREYPSQADVSGQVTNPHTSVVYDVVTRTFAGLLQRRLLDWHNYGLHRDGVHAVAADAPLAAWDAAVGTGLRGTSSTPLAYVPGNYYGDIVYGFNEGAGNVPGGISRITTADGSGTNVPTKLQASFDPPIDKDNTKTLSVTFRKSWGRYVP